MSRAVDIVLIDSDGTDTEAMASAVRNEGIANQIRIMSESEASNHTDSLVLRNFIDIADFRRTLKQRGFGWLVVAEDRA